MAYDKEERIEHLKEIYANDLSFQDYAERTGIAESTLHRWKSQHKEELQDLGFLENPVRKKEEKEEEPKEEPQKDQEKETAGVIEKTLHDQVEEPPEKPEPQPDPGKQIDPDPGEEKKKSFNLEMDKVLIGVAVVTGLGLTFYAIKGGIFNGNKGKEAEGTAGTEGNFDRGLRTRTRNRTTRN